MRGSIRTRYKGSWNIIIDLGYQPDPQTGHLKRKQKWFTVRGTKRDAEKKLVELLHAANRHELIEPTKLTLGQWLETWLETAIKPPKRRLHTYGGYASAIRRHVMPALGAIRLQQLRATDLQRYYTEASLAPSTLALHHAILSTALKAAQMQGLVIRNVATLVVGKPQRPEKHARAVQFCWTAEEARRFLCVAQEASPQVAAFFTVALDTGARRAEICGLRWEDLALQRGQLTVAQQVLKTSPPPLFGPPKNHFPRTITLAPQTVELLRRHRAQQAQVKLAQRPQYHDYNLVFARDWLSGRSRQLLGLPLTFPHISHDTFQQLIHEAGVPVMPFHGLRHTCATLLLQAGVPAHVVQERLGHTRVEMTLGIYAHALPAMQYDAATKLAALIQP